MMVSYRDFLQTHHADLSDAQRHAMQQADAQVLKLVNAHDREITEDVMCLRLIAEAIDPSLNLERIPFYH